VRRADGYATIFQPAAPTLEYDTVQCCHCGGVIRTKPSTLSTVYLVSTLTPAGLIVTTEAPGAGCFKCAKPVCLACYALGTCRPLERWLDEQEGRKRPDQILFGGSR
jgi:hypothetical protein